MGGPEQVGACERYKCQYFACRSIPQSSSCVRTDIPSVQGRSRGSYIFCKRGQRNSYSCSISVYFMQLGSANDGAAPKVILTSHQGTFWNPAPMTSQHIGWLKSNEGAGMLLGIRYVQLKPSNR